MKFSLFKSKAEKERDRAEQERRGRIDAAAGRVIEEDKTGKAGRRDNERRQLDAQQANELKKRLDKALRDFLSECQRMDCDPIVEDKIRDSLLPQVGTLRLENEDLYDAETVTKFVLDAIQSVLLAIRQGDTYAAVIGVNFIQGWLSKLSTPGFVQHFHDPDYVDACKEQLDLQIRIEANKRLEEANRQTAAKITEDFKAGRVTGTRAQTAIDDIKAKNQGYRQQIAAWTKMLKMKNAIITKTEQVEVIINAGSDTIVDDLDKIIDKDADVTDSLNAGMKRQEKLMEDNTTSSRSSITSFNDSSESAMNDEPTTLDLSGI